MTYKEKFKKYPINKMVLCENCEIRVVYGCIYGCVYDNKLPTERQVKAEIERLGYYHLSGQSDCPGTKYHCKVKEVNEGYKTNWVKFFGVQSERNAIYDAYFWIKELK